MSSVRTASGLVASLLACCVAALLDSVPSAGAVHLPGGGGCAPAIRLADDAPEIETPLEEVLDIVFVVGDQANGVHEAEAQIVAALDSAGSVTAVPFSSLTADVAVDADVLVISAATSSSDFRPYLMKANVPIVAMKPANWNALGLTPRTDEETTPLQSIRRLNIESAHTIAHDAGPAIELFADERFWSVGRGWTLDEAPSGPDAPTVVATGAGGAALIAFDKGDRFGWPYLDPADRAPACRVAFPAHGASDALFTDAGLALLVSSVEWAGGADCMPTRAVPATPSIDGAMCRTEPADESRRAAGGELVERAADEEPNLSSLWVRALEYVELTNAGEPAEEAVVPVVFVGGRFQVAYDADASRDDDGDLLDGRPRMGVFACDLRNGTVTDFEVPIEIDSMTPVGNGVLNERVRALAFDGQWLYVGGKFRLSDSVLEDADLDGFRISPTVSLLRVDPATGTIDTSWRPDLRGSVSALTIAGDWLYAAGGLRQADGEAVTRLVRIDIGEEATGRADAGFRPSIEATVPVGDEEPFASVLALEVIDETLFFGGSFQLVDGQPRNSIAAINLDSGELTDFAPSLGDNNFGVDEIAQVKDIVADGRGHVFACGDWWLVAEAPGQTWTAYDVDNDAADPNGSGWIGQRSRVQPRPNQFNVGKFDQTTGASIVDADGVPWGPVTDGGIQACDYDADTDALILGGHYERIGAYDESFITDGGPADDDDYPEGHVAYEKVTAVDGTTGQILAWDPDVDSIRGLDAVRVVPSPLGEGTEIVVGGALLESDRTPREGLARYTWRQTTLLRN